MTGLRGDRKKKTQFLLGETKAAAPAGKEKPNKVQDHLTFFPLESTSPASLSLGKKGKSPGQVDLTATLRQISNIDQQGSNVDFICRDERGRLVLDLSKWDRANELSKEGRGKEGV